MGIRSRVGGALAALMMMMIPRAAAAAPERFGDPGQLVIDQSFVLGAERSSFTAEGLPGMQSNHVMLAPVVSWFVARGLSLRLGITVWHGWSDTEGQDFSGTGVAIGPGVGYALPLGEHFSLWPSVVAGISHGWSDSSLGGMASDVGVGFGAKVPVLWHPAEHFFLGLGPAVGFNFGGERLATLEHSRMSLSLMSTLGGYFSL